MSQQPVNEIPMEGSIWRQCSRWAGWGLVVMHVVLVLPSVLLNWQGYQTVEAVSLAVQMTQCSLLAIWGFAITRSRLLRLLLPVVAVIGPLTISFWCVTNGAAPLFINLLLLFTVQVIVLWLATLIGFGGQAGCLGGRWLSRADWSFGMQTLFTLTAQAAIAFAFINWARWKGLWTLDFLERPMPFIFELVGLWNAMLALGSLIVLESYVNGLSWPKRLSRCLVLVGVCLGMPFLVENVGLAGEFRLFLIIGLCQMTLSLASFWWLYANSLSLSPGEQPNDLPAGCGYGKATNVSVTIS